MYKNKTLLKDKGINQQRCGYNMPPQKDKVCEVSLANMGPCSSEFNYQYPKAQPCVFIKLNKVCVSTMENVKKTLNAVIYTKSLAKI